MASAHAGHVTSFPKLYLIGDSNTQKAFDSTGFGVKLQEAFVRKCDVINRGFSGYTSKDISLIMSNLLKEDNANKSIKFATILLGSNDSVSIELDKRSSTITEYKQSIRSIIKDLKEAEIPHIILISPPPVNVKPWREFCMENYGGDGGFKEESDNTKDYAEACRAIAVEQPEISFLDLYSNILETENWTNLFHDGLHFSVSGNDFVYNKLKGKIESIIADFPMVYPDWKIINQENRAMSLL